MTTDSKNGPHPLKAGSQKVFVDGDRSGHDFTYYQGVLRRGSKIVWECEANAWEHHETASEARACAQKVLDAVAAP